MPILPLGPWKKGLNNVEDDTSKVFSKGSLVTAQNVDLDDDGWPTWRSGTTNRRTGTAHLNLVSCAGLLLLQDGGSIYSVDPDDSFAEVELVSGLNASAKVEFHEWEGDCYYTNGLVCGKILSGGTAKHWGMTVPPVATLSTTGGDLPVGRYRVVVTLLDSDGMESGAPKAAEASQSTMDGTKDLTVDIGSNDANATHANIYVSPANIDEVFWCKKVAIGALPATITDAEISVTPLLSQFMRGPVPGDGLFSYLGYMFTWVNNVIFRSKGQTSNLFYPMTELLTFPHNIRAGLGLQDGFYVATEKTLHWISGSSPDAWKNIQVDKGVYTKGGLVIPGEKIPALETSSLIGLLASDEGLIVLLSEGRIFKLTDKRLSLGSVATTANLVYRETGDLHQVVMLLT